MGLWQKIRKFLVGEGKDDALYFYVQIYQRPHTASADDEIVAIRLNPVNDLSLSDDESSYFARKTVVGTITFRRTEVLFRFDKQRKLIEAQVDNGELVSKAEYLRVNPE